MSVVEPFPTHPPYLETVVVREGDQGDRILVVPEGELDVATVDGLRQELLELAATGWRDLVLDLSRLRFADSSQIHLLLELDAAAAVQGFAFAVRLGGATPARRLLELAGLAERFAAA